MSILSPTKVGNLGTPDSVSSVSCAVKLKTKKELNKMKRTKKNLPWYLTVMIDPILGGFPLCSYVKPLPTWKDLFFFLKAIKKLNN